MDRGVLAEPEPHHNKQEVEDTLELGIAIRRCRDQNIQKLQQQILRKLVTVEAVLGKIDRNVQVVQPGHEVQSVSYIAGKVLH